MRIVIVEDEPVSREALRLRLLREPGVNVVGEAGNGVEAVRLIVEELPDAVFLDIDIPAPDGFAVLREVAPLHLPAVVFVTAHDHFALQAFDVHALDYLLKPIDQERVRRAVERVRRAVGADADQAHDRLGRFLDATTPQTQRQPPATAGRLVARVGDRYRLVELSDVQWIESVGNYVRIHGGRHVHIVRATLRALEESLRANGFVRIHRRYLVRATAVVELRPATHGDYDVLLADGTNLRLSRTYRRNLLP
jgi:two-component system, LytTR family, response regulator